MTLTAPAHDVRSGFRTCRIPPRILAAAAVAIGGLGLPTSAFGQETGELRIVVREAGLDADAGTRPSPARIHLRDADGRAVQPPELPFWHDHFVCEGSVQLALPPGPYSYEIEKGPEYERVSGTVQVRPGQVAVARQTIQRIADLAAENWYCGDLHIHRNPSDIALLARAEGLQFAPVITWWNRTNLWRTRPLPDPTILKIDGRPPLWIDQLSGEDEREGGALLFFGLKSPLQITEASREYPSAIVFARRAQQQNRNVWIDVEKPFWWDVPVWAASGLVDSIGLANNHMCRATMLANEAWGRPRDSTRWPPPRGNGFWSQEIYYELLNTGLRIPPSAGSASGVLPNPVGYNRVYVRVDRPLSNDGWWEALKAGRSFVTNGPLLRCTADGRWPGHVFQSADGPVTLDIAIQLTTREPLEELVIIQNGEIAARLETDSGQDQTLRTQVTLARSGWFLIRAISRVPETFRFASTAPYYVEIGEDTRRVSRRAAEFFLEWAQERAQRLSRNLKDPVQLESVREEHERAIAFWRERVARANAE